MILRNSLFPAVRSSIRKITSVARPSKPGPVDIFYIKVEKAFSPSTPKFATTTKVLERIFDNIAATAATGQMRKDGKKNLLSYIHPRNILTTSDLKLKKEEYQKLLMAAGTFLTRVEECETVRDKAIELLAHKVGFSGDKQKLQSFAALNTEAVETYITAILHELARKGYGSLEVPLDANTVPLLEEAIEVFGQPIYFEKNNKIFSILQMQSLVNNIALHTIEKTPTLEVYRFTAQGSDHGLHHYLLPVIDIENGSTLNIRDVLKFYDSHLGATAFDKMLKMSGKKRDINIMSDEEIRTILSKCVLYKKNIHSGDTFMSSVGLGPNTAATTPPQLLGYFDNTEYEKIDLLTVGFFYIDAKTKTPSIASCTFDAPRRELFAEPLPSEFHIPETVTIGMTPEKSEDYTLSITPEYRNLIFSEAPSRGSIRK